MLIGNAELQDADHIAKIDRICFRRGVGFNNGSVELILNEHSEVLFQIAEHQGQIAGYIFVIPQDGSTDRVRFYTGEACVAQIAGLAVDPNFRRLGVGRSLIESAAREANRHFADCRRIITEAFPYNVPSQSLYLKAGFTPIERLIAYYPDRTDAIRYERPLCISRLLAPAPR